MEPNAAFFEGEFAKIRADLKIPDSFPPDALEAAADASARDPLGSIAAGGSDLRAVPLLTIDPAESLDLDQAFYAERSGDGYTVRYAIADLGFFVDRGGPIEAEAWKRGATLYSPDVNTLLYPPALSHGAASLLPGRDRPSIVFTLLLDGRADARLGSVERAVVRSRAKLSYESVSAHLGSEAERAGSGALAGQEWSESLTLLREIGRKRQAREVERGGVGLPISEQHVERWYAALYGYRLALRNPNDVEGWNAQISIMTGILSAHRLLARGAGLLRSLDPPREDRVRALRLTAAALGVPWPAEDDYASFIRSLDPTNPLHAAVIYHAAGAMGTARYIAFVGTAPGEARHAAIADYYAHVTAPIRRLADRYVLDCLAEPAGPAPTSALLDPLPSLPPVMEAAERRARALERATVDAAEATLLADSVGRIFDALVIRVREDRVTIQIADPAVRADLPAGRSEGADVTHALGDRIRVRLTAADPSTRRVLFAPT